MNIVAWAVAWGGPEPARYHTFFPLWLGYIILIDGVSRNRTQTSLIQRMGSRFVLLFVISIPIWWTFEAANSRLTNWEYVLQHHYPWLQYHAEASLAFSTVVPAIFVTAELVRSMAFPGVIRWLRIAPSRRNLRMISTAGFALFGATMIWPSTLFPLVWISLFLAIDPIVQLAGGKSISGPVRTGRWDTVLVLFSATLICGVLWEFWNFWSMPKWQYQIAFANWLKVFEMPLLGYGGYLSFGLEVYAMFALIDRLLSLKLGRHLGFDQATADQESVLWSYTSSGRLD